MHSNCKQLDTTKSFCIKFGSRLVKRRLLFKNSWVWIPAWDTRWIIFHIYLMLKLYCCLKRPKKRPQMAHLKSWKKYLKTKKQILQKVHLLLQIFQSGQVVSTTNQFLKLPFCYFLYLFLSINAESTHLLCKGKYHCTANLIFYWVGFNQTSTKCDDNFNTTKLLNPNCKTTD